MEQTRRKNAAGDWLRGVILGRTVSGAMMLMLVAGFGVGFAVRGLSFFDGWTGKLVAMALLVGVVLAFAVYNRFFLGSDARWGRGFRAERQVGDLIEHALAGPGCAFAHDVKEALGGAGNVDHVVMTPVGIWIVETKSSWVGRRRFPRVLRQVARNARRVRRHLGTSLPVRGALIIADLADGTLEKCPVRGALIIATWLMAPWRKTTIPRERVKAFDTWTFWRLLRRECEHFPPAGLSPDAARVERLVWHLGSKSHLES